MGRAPQARSLLAFSILLASVGLACALHGESAVAQDTAAVSQAPAPISEEQVQQQINQLQQASGIDEDTRKKVLDLYSSTLEQVRLAKDWTGKATEYEKAVQDTPKLLTKKELEASDTGRPPKPETPKNASLADFEQLLAMAEADLTAAKSIKDGLQKEPGRRVERTRQLPDLIADAAKRLNDAQSQKQSPPADELPEIAQARQVLGQARIEALQAEKTAYERELASYNARTGLLLLQQDWAANDVARKEALVKEWRDIVAGERQKELHRATQEAQKAILEASQAGPAVRKYAETLATENAELVNRRSGPNGLVKKIENAAESLDTLESQVASVQASFEDVKLKTETVGLSSAVGLLLRNALSNLPDLREHRKEIRKRSNEIAEAQMEQFTLQQQRADIANVDGILDAFFEGTGSQSDADQRRVLKQLLLTHRDYLTILTSDYGNYVNSLLNLQLKEQQLIDVTEELSAYIAERIMWVRSMQPIGWSDVAANWAALIWLMDPRHWLAVAEALKDDFVEYFPTYFLAVCTFIALFAGRRKAGRRMLKLGEDVRHLRNRPFLPTGETLLLTVVVTLPWPALLWFFGWRLTGSEDKFVNGVALGCTSAALVFAIFEFIRQLVRRKGIAHAHFDWPSDTVNALRRNLIWLMVFVLAGVFVIGMIEGAGDEPRREALGRFAFVIITFAMAVFAHVLFRPGRGAVWKVTSLLYGSRGNRLSNAAYAFLLTLPTALALLACAGYYYTALRFRWRMFDTVVFGLALLLIRGMILHAFDVARRRHYLEERRKQSAARRREKGDATDTEENQEEEVDWGDVDVQTKNFVKSLLVVSLILGIWIIWSDVLPALGILNRVELWQTTQTVTETAKDSSGQLVSTISQKVVPVTLAHLCLTLLIGFLTVVFVRNLPGILEVAVLQRLPLMAGERYAITTVLRYTVILVGTVAAFQALGVGWGSIQWLVAAMGVGLGFGLQEIFANFISGLVILFERPVRVGDTVTIGGVSGTVTQIRMRATHITDWDRKDLVVPNKEFVTGQLVNWTLSDATLRVVVPVGIAYHSDTEKAARILERVALEHPLVLKTPPPQGLFLGFGESTLNFELRAYSPSIDHLLQIKHDLHMAIDKAFREEHIEIAFPQRDLHLRSFNTDFPFPEKREKQGD